MKVIIETENLKKVPYNFKKNIDHMLKVIPAFHLVGLEKIVVTYEASDEDNLKNVCGLYFGKSTEQRPYIKLYVKNIFLDIPLLLIKFFPFIANLFFSETLYHEIGHHYQKITHGYKKEQWEKSANLYRLRMQRAFFFKNGIGKFLFSSRKTILPIINFIRKKL
jgi:hypothetical protein